MCVTERPLRLENVTEPNHFTVGIRHLDTDRRLSGDRREQSDVVGGDGVGDGSWSTP